MGTCSGCPSAAAVSIWGAEDGEFFSFGFVEDAVSIRYGFIPPAPRPSWISKPRCPHSQHTRGKMRMGQRTENSGGDLCDTVRNNNDRKQGIWKLSDQSEPTAQIE